MSVLENKEESKADEAARVSLEDLRIEGLSDEGELLQILGQFQVMEKKRMNGKWTEVSKIMKNLRQLAEFLGQDNAEKYLGEFVILAFEGGIVAGNPRDWRGRKEDLICLWNVWYQRAEGTLRKQLRKGWKKTAMEDQNRPLGTNAANVGAHRTNLPKERGPAMQVYDGKPEGAFQFVMCLIKEFRDSGMEGVINYLNLGLQGGSQTFAATVDSQDDLSNVIGSFIARFTHRTVAEHCSFFGSTGMMSKEQCPEYLDRLEEMYMALAAAGAQLPESVVIDTFSQHVQAKFPNFGAVLIGGRPVTIEETRRLWGKWSIGIKARGGKHTSTVFQIQDEGEEMKNENGDIQELIALIKSQNESSANRRRGCYICGSFSHFARACPKGNNGGQGKPSPKGDKGGERQCYRCGQFGHLAWRCRAPEPVDLRGKKENEDKQEQASEQGKQDFHSNQQ